MKNHFLLSFILVLACFVNAQEIEWHSEYLEKDNFGNDIVHIDEKIILVKHYDVDGVYFVGLDANSKEKLYTIAHSKPKRFSLDVVDNKILITSLIVNERVKNTYDYMFTSRDLYTGDKIVRKKIKTIRGKKLNSKRVNSTSADGVNKIYCSLYYYDRQEKTHSKFRFLVDSDGEVEVDKYYELKSSPPSEWGYQLSENGSLSYLTKIQNQIIYVHLDAESDYEEWKEIIQFDNLDLDLGSGLSFIQLERSNEDELIIFGSYNKEDSNTDGLIYFIVDNEANEIVDEALIEYPKEMRDNLAEYSDLNFHYLPNNQSFFSILNESYYTINNLILFKVNSSLELDWHQTIKRSIRKYTYRSQYFFTNEGKLNIIYSDLAKGKKENTYVQSIDLVDGSLGERTRIIEGLGTYYGSRYIQNNDLDKIFFFTYNKSNKYPQFAAYKIPSITTASN